MDELEPPADIQTWPDEKPAISKEDEDRLLKVCLPAIQLLFRARSVLARARDVSNGACVFAGVLPGGEGSRPKQ